ncbi:hypothetical protein J6590_025872 [Homalodisca vitripennis]|nr:hypothetical protein J6590_025872 [Homalodisca vitripennis]
MDYEIITFIPSECLVLKITLSLLQTLGETNLQIRLCDSSLAVCEKEKTLGVILDSGLTFSDHKTYATQRALDRLRGLYGFRNRLPDSAKLKITQNVYPPLESRFGPNRRCVKGPDKLHDSQQSLMPWRAEPLYLGHKLSYRERDHSNEHLPRPKTSLSTSAA